MDLGLADESENHRIHEEVLAVAQKSTKNPSMGRQLVKLCSDAGLHVVDVRVHTSVARTIAEFDRVTRMQSFAHIERFRELMEQAEQAGTLCVQFPFVTVVAVKKSE